jgi:hypothetical protein
MWPLFEGMSIPHLSSVHTGHLTTPNCASLHATPILFHPFQSCHDLSAPLDGHARVAVGVTIPTMVKGENSPDTFQLHATDDGVNATPMLYCSV